MIIVGQLQHSTDYRELPTWSKGTWLHVVWSATIDVTTDAVWVIEWWNATFVEYCNMNMSLHLSRYIRTGCIRASQLSFSCIPAQRSVITGSVSEFQITCPDQNSSKGQRAVGSMFQGSGVQCQWNEKADHIARNRTRAFQPNNSDSNPFYWTSSRSSISSWRLHKPAWSRMSNYR